MATINGTTSNDNLIGTSGNDTINGLAGDDTLAGGAGLDVLEGGLGDDRYVMPDKVDQIKESDGQGIDMVVTSINFSLAGYEWVEDLKLTGTAAVNGIGNARNNTLIGSANSAVNKLAGGTGDDTYVVGAGDIVVENDGEGSDEVQSSITWTLSDYIENLVLTGTGNINGFGNGIGNLMNGNDGNNKLDGKGGDDMMFGGAGDDKYYVDSLLDSTIESDNEGTDSVYASVNWDLSAYIENLALIGTGAINGTGNAANNIITGNSAANILNGADGDDTLDGGDGNDQLIGGAGNDTYVWRAGDVMQEVLTGGDGDTIKSSVTQNLNNYEFIENLTLTGTLAINATGTDGANSLKGNDANNVLMGLGGNDWIWGGGGADKMEGGFGNDMYYVDNAADKVIEVDDLSDDGHYDTVQVIGLASYTMAAEVENLYSSGAVTFTGTGNALDNMMTGSSGTDIFYGGAGNDMLLGDDGNDQLYGGAGNDNLSAGKGADALYGGAGNDTLTGGKGADTMAGGLGSDMYWVDNVLDTVMEAADTDPSTQDRVIVGYQSTVAQFTLGDYVERMDYMGTTSFVGYGSAQDNAMNNTGFGSYGNVTFYGLGGDDNLSGNAGSDSLYGGSGNDILSGAAGDDDLYGGAGNDILNGGSGGDAMAGGLGNDQYYVDDALDAVTEVADTSDDAHFDTVHMSSIASYTLGDYVERMMATTTGDFAGTGNALANYMSGGSGNDTLNGAAGNDQLLGNAGDDTLNGDAGDDTLIGYEGNDVLNGGDGNDSLFGSSGSDQMFGGNGNDKYYVDDNGDTVSEAGAIDIADTSHFDIVYIDPGVSTVTAFTLSANVEKLLYEGSVGFTGSGNELANEMEGNTSSDLVLLGLGGNDILRGSHGADFLGGGEGSDALEGNEGNDELDGGLGADTMSGGNGNDIYYVDNVGDTVSEIGDNVNSSDRVFVSTISSYTLADNVEKLNNYNVTGTFEGIGNALSNEMWGYDFADDVFDGKEGNDTLYGNGGSDKLYGGEGNDWLYGYAGSDSLYGGAGNDLLWGGDASDKFHFDSALDGTSNVDTIQSFATGVDKIYLDHAIFTSLLAGMPVEILYQNGADSSSDYLMYDAGNLWYDADGTGTDYEQVLFATLTGNPALVASDIVVY